MAAGIVSVSLRLEHAEFLSGVLLGLTAVAWGLLGLTVVVRASEVPARWRSAARRPAALTAVAGTAVLGTRLALLGWTWAGWPLLALALILWLALAALLVDRSPGLGCELPYRRCAPIARRARRVACPAHWIAVAGHSRRGPVFCSGSRPTR